MQCAVCSTAATSRNYGVLTCFACKMFFYRSSKHNLIYKCRGKNQCFENYSSPIKCRACRFRKCQKVGMKLLSPKMSLPDLDNDLNSLFANLEIRDSSNHSIFLNFYSMEDPSLVDVLNNANIMNLRKRTADVRSDTQEWSLMLSYSKISYFMSFSFINELSLADKLILFTANILRTGTMARAMKAVLEKRSILTFPNEENIFPVEMNSMFENSDVLVHQIGLRIVAKFAELRMDRRDYLLLKMIDFCNPAISEKLSYNAKNILSFHQKVYSSALLRYSQFTNSRTAPTRFTELLSVFNTIHKTVNNIRFSCMMMQCFVPNFKFKRLMREVYFNDWEEKGNTVVLENPI